MVYFNIAFPEKLPQRLDFRNFFTGEQRWKKSIYVERVHKSLTLGYKPLNL